MRIHKEYMGAASEKQVATASDIEVARIVENHTPERILEIVETTNKWFSIYHLHEGIFWSGIDLGKRRMFWRWMPPIVH